MSNPLLRNAVNAALYGSAALALVGAPQVLAQDQDDAEKLETITVTGSRIKRTDIETSQPVFVIGKEDLQRTGLQSIGDVLQELTTNGAALNTTFNNGGNGATNVSLRNLGANRTLVLVNGRRWVTDLFSTVDLNTIPISVIERIEVLKDGASAIYGSDAIAGVINITTRDSYDGAESSAYYGENEEGDGVTQAYDFTIGSSTDRASVVLNASYSKQEPILAGDREISANPLFGFNGNNVTAGASSTTPFGRFGFGNGGQLPNGAPGTLTLIPGRSGAAAEDFKPFSTNTDGFNFAPDNYLLTPQERIGVYAQARYNVTDNISFKTVLLYNERRSSQQLAAVPFTFGTVGAGLGRFNVSADNVYNPFGAEITRAQFRNRTQLRFFEQDNDTFYFAGGFDGSFDLGERSYSWDVNYVYSDNERRDTTEGQFDLNRLRTGLGPSFFDAGGVARCGTPDAVIAGCVPLNIFAGPDGFTQEMADYASFTEQSTRYKDLYSYTANLTGDLFDLPAGPLSFAAGYEYRRESGSDLPDALTASGASTGNIRQPTEGGFSLNEFYVEFNIPVLKDVAFAEVLEFNIAARHSDYSNFGDTLNPKFGFRWKPYADVLVRGNYSEGFRAPAIAELFLGQADSFQNVLDPCSESSQPTGAVLQRCRDGIGNLPGVPVGYEQANNQIRTTVGGNTALDPEKARTKTLGVVYSPSYVEGLDLYLDWYNIAITDPIGAPTAQFLINQCYIFGNLPSCNLMTRDPATGDVNSLFAGTVNNPGILGTEVEGFDFTIDYRFDTDFGKFHINMDNAYISYFGDVGQPDAGDLLSNGTLAGGNFIGTLNGAARFPAWRLRSNIATNWQYGDFGATFTARYVSELDESCAIPVATANNLGDPSLVKCSGPTVVDPQFGGAVNQLDDTWYFDLQGSWDAPWNARITAGVRNLFDEDPPIAYSAFANSFDPGYDVPGRFLYVMYMQKF
jgi:iron complex outermembrane recepter protein